MKRRRCFTDPHYWKNPALRRSREKGDWQWGSIRYTQLTTGGPGGLRKWAAWMGPNFKWTSKWQGETVAVRIAP